MSREIKFRAWHKELEDMIFWDGSKGSKSLFWHNIAEYPKMYEIMQYTGLKDKNGIKIFEGDIFEWEDNDNGVVVFEDASFVFRTKNMSMIMRDHQGMELKIIGNIYETPNLLNHRNKLIIKHPPNH